MDRVTIDLFPVRLEKEYMPLKIMVGQTYLEMEVLVWRMVGDKLKTRICTKHFDYVDLLLMNDVLNQIMPQQRKGDV